MYSFLFKTTSYVHVYPSCLILNTEDRSFLWKFKKIKAQGKNVSKNWEVSIDDCLYFVLYERQAYLWAFY